MSAFEYCDDCGSKLLDVAEDEREEVYCPVCDVGAKVKPDYSGEVGACEDCGTAVATWYPFLSCPVCIIKAHGSKGTSAAHGTMKG